MISVKTTLLRTVFCLGSSCFTPHEGMKLVSVSKCPMQYIFLLQFPFSFPSFPLPMFVPASAQATNSTEERPVLAAAAFVRPRRPVLSWNQRCTKTGVCQNSQLKCAYTRCKYLLKLITFA